MTWSLAQAIADLESYLRSGDDVRNDDVRRTLLPALRHAAKEMTRLRELVGRRNARDAEETIICAAVRMPDGYIVRGHRHDSALITAGGIPRYQQDGEPLFNRVEQGFLTSHNRFVNREIAHWIHFGYAGSLYSEELY